MLSKWHAQTTVYLYGYNSKTQQDLFDDKLSMPNQSYDLKPLISEAYWSFAVVSKISTLCRFC